MIATNVAPIERLVRLLIGAAIIAFAALAMPQVSVLLVAVGLCVAATGLIGFCPACALAGRRLKPRK